MNYVDDVVKSPITFLSMGVDKKVCFKVVDFIECFADMFERGENERAY